VREETGMKNLLRCKACGYIIGESKLGEICPACGVPRTAFEPYVENISKRRKFILDLNIHPILVHFPQAYATILPLLIVLGILIAPPLGSDLLAAARVLSYVLPLTVAAAIAGGLIDGFTRFKKLTTPILIKKIVIGLVLFVLSVIIAVLALFDGFQLSRVYILALSIGCILCEIALGQLGKRLMGARLPG
jgi:rubredoxin